MTHRRPRTIVFDVGALLPTAGAIDQLARIQLAARRAHVRIQLRNLSPELAELIDLAGLSDRLPVEARGKPEEREQGRRVEEERQLNDPAS